MIPRQRVHDVMVSVSAAARTLDARLRQAIPVISDLVYGDDSSRREITSHDLAELATAFHAACELRKSLNTVMDIFHELYGRNTAAVSDDDG